MRASARSQAPAPPGPDLASLAARAGAGDIAAFEVLYRQTVGRVYAVVLRSLQDEDAADSVTQDVFVRAWKAMPGFRGEAAVTTWLHRIAMTAICDEHRRRRPELPTDDEDLAALQQDKAPALADRGEGIDLERAIARLPERARLVYVLHDVAGHRHADIAERLGVTEGTTKAQLFRARRLLRADLDPPGSPP